MKLKKISGKVLQRFKGVIKNQYFIPKNTENSGCSEKSMIMFENFIEQCIEQKVLKEIQYNFDPY
jgi:hypothetical protein